MLVLIFCSLAQICMILGDMLESGQHVVGMAGHQQSLSRFKPGQGA